MSKTNTPRKPKPLYRQKTPKIPGDDFVHAETITPAHFELREDGSIKVIPSRSVENGGRPQGPPVLTFRDDARNLWLYHGNSLELLDAIAAKYPEGRFDAIFADPPYFLSNGGISCHAGKMVKVDKGDWDKSRGAEVNHEFNLEWLKRCQKVLKPNGTIWITGTHHVIFSIGYALQQLGFKILNDIAWEKPNPPPNLSCRYFTHSTETILWAAKTEKSKHLFNYQEMRKVTGKQMKTVWRRGEFHEPQMGTDETQISGKNICENLCESVAEELNPIWTMTAPGGDEKTFGKHPTQKPVALVERCLAASTNPGDLVLDPFLGGGTTAVACARLNRGCVGIEMDEVHIKLSVKRIESALGENTDLFTPPPVRNEIYFFIQIRVVVFARRKNRRLVRARIRKEVANRRCVVNDAPWKVIAEKTGLLRHDFKKGAFHLTAQEIKTATAHFTTTNEREVRILCKQDTRESRPQVFRDNGLFLLPTKNKFYAVVQGEGYVDIPAIKSQPVAYQSKLDFRLETSEVGDSEMQHLDFAYASSLVRTFLDDPSLVLTVRGRKYTPYFSFRVGKTSLTAESVQTEVDAGYEGRNQVALVEAKRSQNSNTIIRQLYFPFRQWQEHTKKPVVTIFFQREGDEYSLWQFRFPDVEDYNSIELVRSQRFLIKSPQLVHS